MPDDTVIISNLPSHSPSGSDYLAVENDSLTGKATVNDVVGASGSVATINTKIGSTALPTTAQTLTGAIAEHESDITALNSKFAYKSGVSLDTLTDSGLYWVYNATGGPPEATYTTWLVIVIAGGGWMKQIATNASNNGVRYERLLTSGTWSDWMLLQDRFSVQSNSSKTITLPAWKNYLVSCTSHLWLVMMQNSTTTPGVVSLYSGESSYRTCVGVSGQNKITLGNTSASTYAFGITTLMV